MTDIRPEFCPHEDGVTISTLQGDVATLCSGCGTEMVWVPKRLLQPPTEAEWMRRRDAEGAVLLDIYHRLGNLLMTRGQR